MAYVLSWCAWPGAAAAGVCVGQLTRVGVGWAVAIAGVVWLALALPLGILTALRDAHRARARRQAP